MGKHLQQLLGGRALLQLSLQQNLCRLFGVHLLLQSMQVPLQKILQAQASRTACCSRAKMHAQLVVKSCIALPDMMAIQTSEGHVCQAMLATGKCCYVHTAILEHWSDTQLEQCA